MTTPTAYKAVDVALPPPPLTHPRPWIWVGAPAPSEEMGALL